MASFDRPKVLFGNRIRKDNGYDPDSYTYYPVAIIGGGESGIAMGCRLKEELGFDQFRIFERQTGVGGTWWINRYPGVACDVPAVFYSFSFCPNHKWSSLYPPGPEIVKYLHGVCEQYGILDKIQLNTEVKYCVWNEAEKVWDLTLQHLLPGVGDLSAYDRSKLEEANPNSVFFSEEKIKAKILISAVGGLVEPNRWPESIPGREDFQGEIFHSARWKYDVDLKDKDVVVVGTGCSAAQFVPQLTTKYGAKKVTQLMRSPPWVVPKIVPPGGEQAWAKNGPWLNENIPGFAKFLRFVIAAKAEYDWRLFGDSAWSEKERKKLEVQLLEHMKKTVPAKYHKMLTPDYGVGCKRRIFDADWFQGLNDPRLELTTLPLTTISAHSVTLGKTPSDQTTIPADVIILANGFEVLRWFHPLSVTGRSGKTLQEVFDERGGPQMYLGAAMDGFPNFFTLFGPNTVTGHSSVVLASENMVNYALKFIAPILAGDTVTVEVKESAEREWTRKVQAALKKTVWSNGGCRSWYLGEDGWNSTGFPWSQVWFTVLCMFPKYRHWDITYTSKGLWKRRGKLALKTAVFVAALVGVVRAKREGWKLSDLRNLVVANVARSVGIAGQALAKVGKA